MHINKLMIYGAYGYSGHLILEELISDRIHAVIAGRDASRLKVLSEKYNCEFRAFDLSKTEIVESNLKDIDTLLNCAGPFRFTAKTLIDACINTGTNYLDITGEIEVIEYAWSKNEIAKTAGVSLIPSVGFDVIPTDCIAMNLKEQLPDAVNLELGIHSTGKISRGTWLTTIEMMGNYGRLRKDGDLINSPIGEKKIKFNKNDFKFTGISIPWGDVSSAYYSTHIPNIIVYLDIPAIIFSLKFLFIPLLKLFNIRFFKNFINKIISSKVYGPNKKERDSANAVVWGMAENSSGEKIWKGIKFIEGYNMTAKGAAKASIKVLNGNIAAGTQTPSTAFGNDFMNDYIIEEIF